MSINLRCVITVYIYKDLLAADRRVRTTVSSMVKSFRSLLDSKFDNSPGRQSISHVIFNITFKEKNGIAISK